MRIAMRFARWLFRAVFRFMQELAGRFPSAGS